MTQESTVHDLLNGLLVTDRESLRFLFHAALGHTAALPPPEQVVGLLTQHMLHSQGNAAEGLTRWLANPHSTPSAHLVPLVRFAGFYRDERLAPLLSALLQQLPWATAHPAAVHALAQLKGPRAAATLTAMLWSKEPAQWHVREPAILRELGHLGDLSTIHDLIRALDVPYPNSARAAAAALAAFPAASVFGPLMAVLRSGESVRAATWAAESLGLLGDAAAIPALQQAAQGRDPHLAVNAAVALARLGANDAVTRLLALATHEQVRVRAQALGAIGLVPAGQLNAHTNAAGRALTTGVRDPQPEVRSAAAWALGSLNRAQGARVIEEALAAEVSPIVRAAMIRALGRLAQSSSLTVLVPLLHREDPSVQIAILEALSCYRDPAVAQHIVPFRAAPDPRLVDAAERALRRLLHRPFAWPDPAAPASGERLSIDLYSLTGARDRLLPPPPPPPPPGFFGRVFGARAAPPPPATPTAIGRLDLDEDGVRVTLNPTTAEPGWSAGAIAWAQPFSAHVTREPITEAAAAEQRDIGVHFILRQRADDVGAHFHTVAVSLWCAPSEAVGPLPAKSERLPCLDPHNADPFIAALRCYAELYGLKLDKG